MPEGNSQFLMAVGQIDGGLAVETADQCITDVVNAVRRTGKKGTVTVTLEFSPNGEMGLAATAKVAAKAPQVNFGQSFFFTDRHGKLTRQSPDMQQLGLMQATEESNG